MDAADTGGTVTWLWRDRAATPKPQLFTIKDVVTACGLPGPVIMQLVPRTWTDAGWMFTAEQVEASVEIAAEHRRRLSAERRGH